jgi:purine-nucleoside phosphorylase
MGGVARALVNPKSVAFAEIPGLPAATVQGHKGCLSLGEWAGQLVLVLEGRLHYYEGHTWESVIKPIQTVAALGVRQVLLTNAAGGIRADLGPGSLMLLSDHLEWTRPYSWRQTGPGGLGPGRPSPYSPELMDRLEIAAAAMNLSLARGVYAMVTGPSYETPAEIRALRACGADAVGMSTAREAQAGVEAGLECAALSLITNRAAGLAAGGLHHAEVLAMANTTAGRLIELLERFLAAEVKGS